MNNKLIGQSVLPGLESFVSNQDLEAVQIENDEPTQPADVIISQAKSVNERIPTINYHGDFLTAREFESIGDITRNDQLISELLAGERRALLHVRYLPISVLQEMKERKLFPATLGDLHIIKLKLMRPELAEALLGIGFGAGFDGLVRIDSKTAEFLGQRGGGVLQLNGLEELSSSEAKGLAQFGGSLGLGGLKNLSAAAAFELGKGKCSLVMSGLKQMPVEVAKALAEGSAFKPEGENSSSQETSKGTLDLGRLETDSAEVVKYLTDTGRHLILSALKKLTAEMAKELSRCKYLMLDGVTELGVAEAEALAEMDGILFLGLKEMSVEVARALSKHTGILSLRSFKSLKGDVAAEFTKHCGGNDIALESLQDIDDQAEELIVNGKLKIRRLPHPIRDMLGIPHY